MTTLPSTSEILEHHYQYEIEMLARTYTLLDDFRIQQNALIEAFCLHARNLIEFYFDEVKKGHPYTEPSYDPFANKKTRVGKLNQIINHQISHLDRSQRTTKDADKTSDKERSELIDLLSTETAAFRKHLKSEYRGLSISTLTQQNHSANSAGRRSLAGGHTGPAGNYVYQVSDRPQSSGATTTTARSEVRTSGPYGPNKQN